MHDDFQPGLETLDDFEGATAALFPHFFIAGEGDGPRHDAAVLVAALVGHSKAVGARERANLIVTGSAPDAAPGRVTLDP
ncbi:MAG TPA: hypothetical protein VJL81_15720, partial [Solirubrobacterales bacterium]|nr:hypothetical protein [Solirubrobacterales bacterium]